MRVDACHTEIEHQCHSCYVFHLCLLFFGGDHGETLFSFRNYRRERTAKAATFWYIFCAHWENGLFIDARSAEITNLLKAWGSGDKAALGQLAEHVYPELHQMARRYLTNEREGNTLQATAVIHEVYLRLVEVTHVEWQARAQF